MDRHDRPLVCLTGGEPLLPRYHDHVVELCAILVAESVAVQDETAGVTATPEVMDQLDGLGGAIGVRWSVKAQTSESWAAHTGRPMAEFRLVMLNLFAALGREHNLVHTVAFVDKLRTDPDLPARLEDDYGVDGVWVERLMSYKGKA